MGLLKWLFGNKESGSKALVSPDNTWQLSENGNPTLLAGSKRLTVFAQDGGWKYCIADIDDRKEPYFSDAYASELEAKEEALARFWGKPSRHLSITELRRQHWDKEIQERSSSQIEEHALAINEIENLISSDKTAGLTELRKIAAKIKRHQNSLSAQIKDFGRAGVSDDVIFMAEFKLTTLRQLDSDVSDLISKREQERRRKPLSRK